MIIVEPKAELWKQGEDIKAHIVRCAKVCYRSERDVDNDKFLDARIKGGHLSIFRHGTKYYKIPIVNLTDHIAKVISNNVFINHICKQSCVYLAINSQYLLDNEFFSYAIEKFEIDILEAESTEIIFKNIFRYSFYLQTQISTTRELNRVSPNNILEESTRYVDQGTICRPWWFDLPNKYDKRIKDRYLNSINESFYNYQINLMEGMNKQDARGLLPLDTCTHVVYTYSIKEWRDIIDKRYYGTTGRPHPNCVEIMEKIVNLLKEEGHEFRNR